MKFTLAIEKKNSANLGQAEGHNTRSHATRSQQPQAAWLTAQGHHTIKRWKSAVVDQAKELAKRRDAVLAIELVIQVGNQTDWREAPSTEHPAGKPRQGNTRKINALIAGVKAAVAAEIGWDRVISAEVHTDESSPHVHVVFAPVTEGKLQAKNWVGGAAKCAQLREKIHAHVTQHLPCEYTKGAAGGSPHEPAMAAGQPRAITGGVVASLKSTIERLEQQVQQLFSQLKTEQKKAQRVQIDNDDLLEKAARKMEQLQAEIERLRPRPAPAVQSDKREAAPPAPPVGPGLRPGPAPGRR